MMYKNNIKKLTLVGLILLIVACGGTFVMKPLSTNISSAKTTKYYLTDIVDRTGGSFDAANKGALVNTIHDGLAQAGMITSTKEKATHLVKISVTAYTRRNGAARFFLGAFSGSDSFNAIIELTDQSGNNIVSGNLENSDASIMGSADDMVRDSGKKIVAYLTGKIKKEDES